MSAPEPRSGPAADRAHDPVAYLALLGMALSFGGTWVAAAWTTAEIPPLSAALVRFVLASGLLLGLAIVLRVPVRVERDRWPAIVGMAVTGVAAYNVLFLTGVTLAPASDGALIVPGTTPMVTALLQRFVFRQPLPAGTPLGLVVALAGLALVVGPVLGGSPRQLSGDLMFLGCALLWGGYPFFSRRAALQPVVASFHGAWVGALLLAPVALLEGGLAAFPVASSRALLSLGYLIVFGAVAAFVLFNEGIRRIGSARASAFVVLVPVVGVASSVVLLGEELTPAKFAGTVLVLVGLWIVQARPARRPDVASPAGANAR